MKKKEKTKTILIGCGRIGVGNGPLTQRRTSHAGTLAAMDGFELSLYDPNPSLAKLSAKIFGVNFVEETEIDCLNDLDCAIICSPTNTHYEYLARFLIAEIPIIVCEKPVCADLTEAKKIEQLRLRSKSKVLINYTRRFQPGFAKLKKKLSLLMRKESVRSISIRYQRGFLNNASHALDLIQFLTGWEIQKAKVRAVQIVKDEFSNDPTLSCHGEWKEAQFSILGLPYVRFSLFEIDFFFDRSAIRIRNRGDTIEVAGSEEPADYYAPLTSKKILKGNSKNPLENLYRYVQLIMRNSQIKDNFQDSLNLTSWALGVHKEAVKGLNQ